MWFQYWLTSLCIQILALVTIPQAQNSHDNPKHIPFDHIKPLPCLVIVIYMVQFKVMRIVLVSQHKDPVTSGVQSPAMRRSHRKPCCLKWFCRLQERNWMEQRYDWLHNFLLWLSTSHANENFCTLPWQVDCTLQQRHYAVRGCTLYARLTLSSRRKSAVTKPRDVPCARRG